MLVLTRKLGEEIRIGDDISFVVLEVQAKRVRIGIDAPRSVRVVRQELVGSSGRIGAAELRKEEVLQHAAGNLVPGS